MTDTFVSLFCTARLIGRDGLAYDIDGLAEIRIDGIDGQWNIHTLSFSTPGEKLPYLFVGRDHPLFEALEAGVNKQHIEDELKARKDGD